MGTTARFDEKRFNELLDQWNTHQTLRSAGAEIATLAQSRARLDEARLDLHRVG